MGYVKFNDKRWQNLSLTLALVVRIMYPLVEVGEMESNRNPDNYFEQVEQSADSPAKELQEKMVKHFRKADKDYVDRISKGTGLKG